MSIALGNIVNLKGQVHQGLVIFGESEPFSDLSRRLLGVAVGRFPKVLGQLFSVLGVLRHSVLFVDPFARFLDGFKNVLTKPGREFHRAITSQYALWFWSFPRSELERIEKRGLEVKG